MKSYSTKKPLTYFFHKLPRANNRTIVRFCEDIMEAENGWEYDEYIVEVETKPNMDEYIQNHWNELRQEAVGGMSLVEHLYAKIDYISMMSGISIPTGEGAENG